VGSSKNLGRATFRKMPEAGLKIAQKGLKNTFFWQNFAEAPSLARVWVGYFGFWGGGLNPPRPPHAQVWVSLFQETGIFVGCPLQSMKLAFLFWYDHDPYVTCITYNTIRRSKTRTQTSYTERFNEKKTLFK